MKKSSGKFRYILILILVFGFSITALLYPFISNYLYEHRAEDIIDTYKEEVSASDDDEELKKAEEFNEALVKGNVVLQDPFAENISGVNEEEYESILRINGSEAMGYINIPEIGVELPIYHGTSQEVLKSGVGHLKGSSFPVGGESTHAVLTGHTGLSSAKLFTDLTKLEEGDYFFITMGTRKLCYQVDQIKVVNPDDVSDLSIVSGKDYCTLVTCTPYGINTHRLLVRGERAEYTEELEASIEPESIEESEWMSQYKKAIIISFIAVGIAAALVLLIMKIVRKRRSRKER